MHRHTRAGCSRAPPARARRALLQRDLQEGTPNEGTQEAEWTRFPRWGEPGANSSRTQSDIRNERSEPMLLNGPP